jgi:hypothetical protein
MQALSHTTGIAIHQCHPGRLDQGIPAPIGAGSDAGRQPADRGGLTQGATAVPGTSTSTTVRAVGYKNVSLDARIVNRTLTIRGTGN